MATLSPHENTSIERRIALVEAGLRQLVDDPMPGAMKLRRWQALYGELKSLRQQRLPHRFTVTSLLSDARERAS